MRIDEHTARGCLFVTGLFIFIPMGIITLFDEFEMGLKFIFFGLIFVLLWYLKNYKKN